MVLLENKHIFLKRYITNFAGRFTSVVSKDSVLVLKNVPSEVVTLLWDNSSCSKMTFFQWGGRSRLVFHWSCHEKYPLCVAERLQWCSQMRGVLTGLQVMKFLVFYLLLPIASITAVEWKLNTQKEMLLFLGYTERRWYSLPFICCLISATKIPTSLVTFM